jgi:hypothetical protein
VRCGRLHHHICTAAACSAPAPQPPQPRTGTAIATMGMPLPIPSAVEVDIREQPDAPIHLTVDEAVKGRMPGTPLKVRNDSGSAVAAYVLRVDVEPFGLNQMVVVGQKGWRLAMRAFRRCLCRITVKGRQSRLFPLTMCSSPTARRGAKTASADQNTSPTISKAAMRRSHACRNAGRAGRRRY